MIRPFLIFFWCMIALNGVVAQSIKFSHTTLDQALKRAKKQNKSVFVDAYAQWCIPCKKMDITFRDPQVGKVYNNNFINLKLDMDLPSSLEVKAKYDIIFLPTIMILDPDGKVRYKVDRVLSKEELLNIANLTADPNVYFASEATQIVSSPVVGRNNNEETIDPIETVKPSPTTQVTTADVIKKSGEKIIYVLDGDNQNVPPEVLYQEAYFRMELMDGSHYAAARRYLESQTDWTNEKNTRFIFDFLHDVNSEMFQYFINNEATFQQYYSKEQIRITKEHLVFQRLNQGFPRPQINEVIQLFSLLYGDSAEQLALKHFMSRLKNDLKTSDYRRMATTYMADYPNDHRAKYEYVKYLLSQKKFTAGDIKDYIKTMDAAIALNDQNPHYYHILARVYYLNGNKSKAMALAEKAIVVFKSKGEDYTATKTLKDMIAQL